MNARTSPGACCEGSGHASRALLLLAAITVAAGIAAASYPGEHHPPKRVHARVYRIALSYPFPPWDVGPLEGVDYDLLTAICEANASMKCLIVDRPSGDCVDTDENGQMVIGPGLSSGKVDGCMPWFGTDERKRLGGEFSNGYSRGPLPQLIAVEGDPRYDGLLDGGSLGDANVAFIAGFFTDDLCLGRHYSDFVTKGFYDSDQDGRDQMVSDLFDGIVDLVFWDSVETLPEGTQLVGVGITDCAPLLSLITYPPRARQSHQADELRRDFNCGLALIRESGQMQEICENSPHPGGDPTCVFEGPPPTVQCVEANSEDDGSPPRRRR